MRGSNPEHPGRLEPLGSKDCTNRAYDWFEVVRLIPIVERKQLSIGAETASMPNEGVKLIKTSKFVDWRIGQISVSLNH